MRNQPTALACLGLIACAPQTDLRQDQAAPTTTETTNDSLTSPEKDPLAGQLVEPPNGVSGIPPNLATLIVRFTEPVQPAGPIPAFVLRSTAGDELQLSVGEAAPCAGACYQVPLPFELAPSVRYTLESLPGALQFLDGKPVPAGSAGAFTTSEAADRFAPRVVGFTATATEGCLFAHLDADEPVRAVITVSAGGQTASIPIGDYAASLDFAQRVSELPAGASAQAVAHVVDRAGNAADSAAVTLSLPPALPRIVITEVLANPAGSETTQEFVELYNAGQADVAVGGLVIADKSGSDVLPAAILAPEAFALVVAEKYDPAEGSDIPPREGSLLLLVPGKIGADGLSNGGEPVRLSTPAGDLISQYGGWVDVSASAWSGKSVKRISVDACDAPAAWSSTPSPASPGF
jgi:hypothetical protein